MSVYTFMICIFIISVSDYKPVSSRATYDNPSYNSDRDESLSALSAHQKKRLANEDALREENQAEYEHNAPLYETQRFRKFDPETNYARHENRLEKNRELADFDESKMNMQKRDYYDAANNPKDASIEVILDPRAKKAVAVVENSPSGQAMYDLSGWKNNKDDSSAYDADQYTPGTQEQVVNLVYPAERNERKYSAFESNSDYSDKSKAGFKDKLIENDRAAEDTHKRKRNADTKNKSDKDNEKRSSQDKSKRKSDQKSESKSNECPPHNTPSTMETDSNKNDDEDKFAKQQTVKREAPQWSQQQLDALKNSLAHVNENSGEVQNLRNILTDMGLINEGQLTKKRETAKIDPTSSPTVKLEEDKEKLNNNDLKADIEDEDLNQDNIILKRNGREITHEDNEEDVNKAPVEPIEKRDAEEEVNSEEEENEEAFDTQDEKKEVKRSNNEPEAVNADAKVETSAKEVAQSREKRQDTDTNQNLMNKAEIGEKSKAIPTSDSEINKNTNDNTKKYIKRETNGDDSKELRKNRQNQETDEEYEKRMESQIQAKIDAIKEKVKREILEEQFKRRYKRNPNIEEAFRTNIRQRRQTKEQSKEEMKSLKDTDNLNKEKSVESPEINPAEPQAKIVRRKRANTLPEKQMVYRGFQTDQDDEAEDDNEFDDNAYDGRMYLEKRQAEDDNDYYDPVRKREVEGYLQQYYPEARNRRSFSNDGFAEDSNAFHGSRRALKNKGFTGRENQEEYNAKSNENNDNEYFGSLPQTYNGELTRYKRVKRDNPYK